MVKITALNLSQVTHDKIVARYPLSGDIKDVFECKDDNECEKWAVNKVTGSGIELCVQFMGLINGVAKRTLTYQDAINGYWWVEL